MSLTSSANVKSVKVSVPMKRVYNEKATTKKELVYVDIDELVASNDIARFNTLSEQMANGEILVVCKIESSGTCGVADLIKEYAGSYSWQVVTSDSWGQITAISIKSNNVYMTVYVTTGYLAEEEMPLEKAKAYTDKKFSEFNFITAVPFLPETGETNKLYLVLKEESEEKNEFDEYVWANNAWEYVGSTKISGDIDLSNYVQKTDIATSENTGVVKKYANGEAYSGIDIGKDGTVSLLGAFGQLSDVYFKNPQYYAAPVLAKNLYRWIKVGLVQNTETLTEEEQASARAWLGAVGNTDYATYEMAGVVKSNPEKGFIVDSNGVASLYQASKVDIDEKKNLYKPITPFRLDYAVKVGVTTNTETLTADEQKSACDWLGAVKKLEPLSTPSVIVQNSDGTMVAKRIAYDNYSPLGAIAVLVPADSAKNEPAGVNVTGTPKGDWDCTPKKYVNNLPDYLTLTDEEKAKWTDTIGAVKENTSTSTKLRLYAVNPDGTQTVVDASNVREGNAVVRYSADGRVDVGDPYRDYQAANKKYVDEAINGANEYTDEQVTAASTSLSGEIQTVESIAKGANQALSYGDYSTLITTLNALPNTAIRVGQNLYIVTVGVPDLWVSEITEIPETYAYTTDEDFTNALKTNGYVQVGYYKLAALETQKVDLTDYVKNTDYADTNKAGLVQSSKQYYAFIVDPKNGWVRADVVTLQEYTEEKVYKPAAFVSKGTLENVKGDIVKRAVTEGLMTLTDEEKAKWTDTIGAAQKPTTGNSVVYYDAHLNAGFILVNEKTDGTEAPQAYRFGRYMTGGTLPCGTPTQPYYAANKEYVDNLPDYLTLTEEEKTEWTEMIGAVKQYQTGGATRLYGVNRQGAQVQLLGADIASAIHTGRIAMYLTDAGHDISTEPDGALVTKTPVKDYQCANKKYVDKAFTVSDEDIDNMFA